MDSTRSLVEAVIGQAEKPQEVFQTVTNSAVAAQERNIQFAQSIVENGIQVLHSHAEANRALTQELIEQTRKQQEIFQSLVSELMKAYVNTFSTPFSYYKQALDLAESATRQGLETFQQAGRQGLDTFRNVARQARENYQNVGQ